MSYLGGPWFRNYTISNAEETRSSTTNLLSIINHCALRFFGESCFSTNGSRPRSLLWIYFFVRPTQLLKVNNSSKKKASKFAHFRVQYIIVSFLKKKKHIRQSRNPRSALFWVQVRSPCLPSWAIGREYGILIYALRKSRHSEDAWPFPSLRLANRETEQQWEEVNLIINQYTTNEI